MATTKLKTREIDGRLLQWGEGEPNHIAQRGAEYIDLSETSTGSGIQKRDVWININGNSNGWGAETEFIGISFGE